MPRLYPQRLPQVRIKNLSPEIINNNKMMEFEGLVRAKAEENVGNMMIFEICDALREQIQEMNEIILNKLHEFEEKHSINEGLKAVLVSTNETQMTYTPVTKETFEKWCKIYMEKLQKLKEERKNDKDLKLTGK